MKNNQDMKKPFFANFLENQLPKEDAGHIQGGTSNPVLDNAQTMKYPSDQEDHTSKATDLEHTMKYPSDGDDDILDV